MSMPHSAPLLPSPLELFAADVRRGLSATPRRLNPAYFYDALGSSLFDAICQLPSYPITRCELALLERHAGEIVAWTFCGNGEREKWRKARWSEAASTDTPIGTARFDSV